MHLYHLRQALKHLLRFKSHTVYSLVGLILGLACVFIIAAWTMQELRFDRFHNQSDHIYMLTTDIQNNNSTVYRMPETPAPLAAEIEKQLPQVDKSFQFIYLYGGRIIELDDRSFKELGIAVDSKFLEVLNFTLLSGTSSFLNEPNVIFLSESLAEKLFPGEDPVEKLLRYKGEKELTVKGVFQDVPFNSSLQFEFLVPYQTESENISSWRQLSDATFIKISEFSDPEEVLTSIKQIWREGIDDDQYDVGFIPITDLRYGAKFEFFNAEHGDSKKLYMFIGLAFLILILACLNYMNLISAYSLKRGSEVWIRKVHGASSGDITKYFVIESILLSILAWGLAILLSLLGIHFFELLLNVTISKAYFLTSIGFGLIASILIVGVATGVYPAIRISSELLIKSENSGIKDHRFQRKLKNAFVLSQFILSISLSITSLVILRQTNFMKSFEVGYEKENIVGVHLPVKMMDDVQAIKNSLNAIPNIEEFTFAGSSPVNLHPIFTTENWTWEGLQEGTHTSFYRLFVDSDYLDVFQIPLVDGRFFSGTVSDSNRIVINEKLASYLGFANPIGEIIKRGEKSHEIIGIVKDFHFQDLSNDILPLILMYNDSKNNAYIKITPPIKPALTQIQSQFASFSDQPFDFRFINEAYEDLYENERKIISGLLVFTIFSIFLSCLGLIALVTYSTELRTKEIAVRRTYGADINGIMIKLNLSIIKLFGVGMLTGSMIAWFIAKKWLESFVIRVSIDWWIYLLGGLAILIITMLAVSAQTLKAARMNPVDALKIE
jgi:putative ABC transport system permease protein